MRRANLQNLWWRLVATLASNSFAVFVCCVLWVCSGLCLVFGVCLCVLVSLVVGVTISIDYSNLNLWRPFPQKFEGNLATFLHCESSTQEIPLLEMRALSTEDGRSTFPT